MGRGGRTHLWSPSSLSAFTGGWGNGQRRQTQALLSHYVGNKSVLLLLKFFSEMGIKQETKLKMSPGKGGEVR